MNLECGDRRGGAGILGPACTGWAFEAASPGWAAGLRLSSGGSGGSSGSVEAVVRRRGGVLWLFADDLRGTGDSAMWRAALGVAVRHEGGRDGAAGPAGGRREKLRSSADELLLSRGQCRRPAPISDETHHERPPADTDAGKGRRGSNCRSLEGGQTPALPGSRRSASPGALCRVHTARADADSSPWRTRQRTD
jgi:hypothetical protein